MARLRHLARASERFVDSNVHEGLDRLTAQVGGRARVQVVVMLAAVLGLDSADQGAIGAVAPQLEVSLHVSTVGLGLLVTVTALVGAAATVPMGSLVDRTNRVRLLAAAVVVWGVAEAVSGGAMSYVMLVCTRVALGAVVSVAAPAVASLTGDLFPPSERGRIYGFIITGELLGAGFGVLISGLVAGWFGWRPAMAILAIPSIAVAYVLWRYLPEPARGGASWLRRGTVSIPLAEEANRRRDQDAPEDVTPGEDGTRRVILEQIDRQGVEAEEEIVIDEDPSRWRLRRAVRYVLSVKTNVVMIVASSVGYFFFAGLKTFAVLFVRGNFQISQSVATLLVVVVGIGAVAGVVLAGHRSDRLIAKGRITVRLDIGIIGYVLAAALLVPAVLTSNLALALPLMVLAAAGVAAPNGTLDAARLDVVPSQLWGRAEAVRTVVRTTLEAFAPLTFGLVAQQFGGSSVGFGSAASGAKSAPGSPAEVRGLRDAFLVMLVPLATSGLMLILGRRSYPVDVASAAESQQRVQERLRSDGPADDDDRDDDDRAGDEQAG
jgi:MFS family permease